MKITSIIFAATVLFFTSCSNPDTVGSGPVKEHITVNDNKPISRTIEVKSDTVQVSVGEKNFEKMVAFIEKNGSVTFEKGVPCDRKYIFFDKDRNRHELITIKRDSDGEPSNKGKIAQISVYGYYQGIKDHNHFFGYSITAERAFPFQTSDDAVAKHIGAVKKGYQDFLVKVNQ